MPAVRTVRRSVVAMLAALALGLATALVGVALPAQADDPSTFTTVGTPVVSGNAYVGSCLTAQVGSWDPSPDSFGYQWERDGSPIDGATSAKYRATSDDLGGQLSVVVTASKAGFVDTPSPSAATDAVAEPGSLTTDQPTITGSPVVGSDLTADAGEWGPGDVTLSYAWMSAGSVVQHGPSDTYTPTSTDVDNPITVKVRGTEPTFAPATQTSDPTLAVVRAPFNPGTPTITGGTTVGSQLTADPGTWVPVPAAFDYSWKSNGTVVQHGPGATYTLAAGDVDNTVTVTVTGTKPGFFPASVTSDPTATVSESTLTTAVPTISGTAAVGSPLTASAGAWGPGTVTFDYRWFSNGSQVQDGPSATYTPVFADLTNAITVTVTGSEPGYFDAFQTSTATAGVAQGTLSPGAPTLSGSNSVGSTLTANPGSWGPGPVTLDYSWGNGGATPLQDGPSATYTLVPSDLGSTITLTVTGSEPGFTSAQATVSTPTIAAGTLTTGTPTLPSGSPVVGTAVTANPGSWGPGTVTFDYQFFSAGSLVQDGPGPAYTPVASDVGNVITVVVRGSKPGYGDATSLPSAATSKVVAGTLVVSGKPILLGTTFTQTLTIGNPVQVWGPGTVALSYQWLRNGVAISGQSTSSYTPLASDVGQSISLQVTGSKVGYTSKTSTSDPVVIAPATFAAAPVPTLKAASSIGNTIQAATVGWSPTPDSFVYTWFRNGALVTNTSQDPSAYQLTPDDVNAVIAVQVTGVKAGYTPVTPAMSAPSPTVQPFQPTFTNSVAPTVTGVYKVDSTLTASPGTWTPSDGTYAYTWLRGTGDPDLGDYQPIPGATSTTYKLTALDFDQQIILRVTASKDLYKSKTALSSEADKVAAGALTAGSPTVTGTPQVGATLTANPGNWSPSGISFEYKWSAGSNEVQVGPSATYVPKSGDLGQPIKVQVIGTEFGYDSNNQFSGPTAAVVQGQFATPLPQPTISGTATPGHTLTATGVVSSSQRPIAYQWNLDGTAIPGETGATLALSNNDAGHTVTVAVTDTLDGYAPTHATSDPLPIAQLTFGTPPKPTITGTAKVGSTLTAKAGTWSPSSASPVFTYAWHVTGSTTPQPTETGATFKPTSVDVGHEVSVTVTANAPGYAARSSAASSVTKKVVTGTLVSATPTVSDTTPTVNVAVTANVGTWSPGTTFTYQWYRGSTSLSGGKAASYTPTGSDYGHTLKVKVTGHLSGYTSVSKTSKSTKDVGRGTLTSTTTPVVTGDLVVGSTLTATVPAWTPSTVTMSYQWYRSKTTTGTLSSISGAKSHTYKLTSTSLGYYLFVKVTGTKTGYSTQSKTSAASDSVVITAP